MAVPWYQLVVGVGVAALLLFVAIYTPLLFGRRLPRWIEVSLVMVAVVLCCGVIFAAFTGHWPFRG